MDALLMCGGRGTRLDTDIEKPLYEVRGVPMVDHVRAALESSAIENTYAVVSSNTPSTHEHLSGKLECFKTPGEGYVADLSIALEEVKQPVLTVAADLPLLAGEIIDHVLAVSDGATMTLAPRSLKVVLGVSIDYDKRWVPAGLNVVDDGADTHIRCWDARLAVNVNRKRDALAAERLLPNDGY